MAGVTRPASTPTVRRLTTHRQLLIEFSHNFGASSVPLYRAGLRGIEVWAAAVLLIRCSFIKALELLILKCSHVLQKSAPLHWDWRTGGSDMVS